MRILVSGGGLAGLTLAYWLHQYGFTPVVIEQANGIRRSGYGIDFFGTGYDVAARMGLIERLQARKIPAEYVAYVTESDDIVAKLDIALMEKIMYGKYMALMHWTLEEALYQAIADDVEVRFGYSISAIQQSTDGVTMMFNDGTTDTFDLLIGAEGIHSKTRGLVFLPETQFGVYMGYYIACYALPDTYGVGHHWKNYTEPKRQVGVYCSSNEGEIVTLFMYEAEDEGPIPQEKRLQRLHDVFDDMGWLTSQLLDDVPDPNAIYMDTVTQIRMPAWSKGRVALVGDACGCMTLISGQGASMAMGGAYVLAEALRDNPRYQDAFQQYESIMRPHIESRQKSAKDFAKAFVPGSALGLTLQKIIMKVIMREQFTGLLRRQFGAESILPVAN